MDKKLVANTAGMPTERKRPKQVQDSGLKIKAFRDSKWRSFLVNNCGGYKNPVIVNGQVYLKSDLDDSADIYVFKEFVKSGKQTFAIEFEGKMHISHYAVRHREEEIPMYQRIYKKKLERVYS